MVGQIGPLVQVGRKNTALALHVLGGVAGGLAIGVVLGFLGVLLRAAIGDTLDTVFIVVVPAALIYAALVDLGVLPVRSRSSRRSHRRRTTSPPCVTRSPAGC
jgi:cation transporter-like permease